jgi:hypothetical protein
MRCDLFLVRDWTDVLPGRPGGPPAGKPKHEIVHGVEQVVAAIDRAKQDGRKISVYEVGKCLLDWS